jgi:hypothetical protein
MNRIQKTGVIIGLILMPFGFMSGAIGDLFGFLSFTTFFIGYVAGSLWRIRHVLRFWWSTTIALVVHCCLYPIYVRLMEAMRNTPKQGGKLYMYMMFGLMITEVLISISVSKKLASRMRRRPGKHLPEHYDQGPGSLLA